MHFARYDRIVAHYPSMWPLLVPGYEPILNAMLDVVEVRDNKPRSILDVGCGPGSATIAVAPACHSEGRVTVVDGSPRMAAAAAEMLDGYIRDTFVGDFTEAGTADCVFRDATYDLILCSFALHHLDDGTKRRTIDAMGSSLQPGGLLLLADEVVSDRPAGWEGVERIRGRIIQKHLDAGDITEEFWHLETSLEPEAQLPFLPTRIDDMVSFLARAGLAVSCPVSILGSALLVALKPK